MAGTESACKQVHGTKVKDPRWLRVDICRDFAAGKCKRTEFQCRFAHPKKDCVSENSKVIVCYDSMKGKCCRESCKFYHPPFHIKEHLLAFGKYLQQQRLERDKAIEISSTSSATESNETAGVCTSSSSSSDGSEEVMHQTTAGSQRDFNETTLRRNSDHAGQYLYHEPPVYVCEDNMGTVYYTAIPTANYPTWSTPQHLYYQPVQRPALGSRTLICQGYPVATVQVPCASPAYYPFQHGRGNIVPSDLQSYPTSPQVIMVAGPQLGMVSPGWPHCPGPFFPTTGYSADANRPNSI